MTINNGLLVYIKAFRQRADADSIRNHLLSKYNASMMRTVKELLWDGCGDDLCRLKVEKGQAHLLHTFIGAS